MQSYFDLFQWVQQVSKSSHLVVEEISFAVPLPDRHRLPYDDTLLAQDFLFPLMVEHGRPGLVRGAGLPGDQPLGHGAPVLDQVPRQVLLAVEGLSAQAANVVLHIQVHRHEVTPQTPCHKQFVKNVCLISICFQQQLRLHVYHDGQSIK